MKRKVHKKKSLPEEVTAIRIKSEKQEEGLRLLRRKENLGGAGGKQQTNLMKCHPITFNLFQSLKTSVPGYNFYKHVLFVLLIPLEL